jgi:hypothetical protein
MGKRDREALTAVECAVRLRIWRERLIRMIQCGLLSGRRDPDRGWLVDLESVRRLEREAKRHG